MQIGLTLIHTVKGLMISVLCLVSYFSGLPGPKSTFHQHTLCDCLQQHFFRIDLGGEQLSLVSDRYCILIFEAPPLFQSL
jgi:hypothetical protein